MSLTENGKPIDWSRKHSHSCLGNHLATPALIHFSVLFVLPPHRPPPFKCQSHSMLLKRGSCKPMVSYGLLLCTCACVYECECVNLSVLVCVNTTQTDAFGPTNDSNQQAITAHIVSLWEGWRVGEREGVKESIFCWDFLIKGEEIYQESKPTEAFIFFPKNLFFLTHLWIQFLVSELIKLLSIQQQSSFSILATQPWEHERQIAKIQLSAPWCFQQQPPLWWRG